MPWPLSQDYNEAIQTPTQCFSDPDLRQGEAVTNTLGLPTPCSGNFADVYAVQAGQHKWAVKCFTRQIQGLRERYAEISKYLQKVTLPFMVDFKFLEQGIRVRGQWYPALKMQWVEGLSLNQFVKAQRDKPHMLEKLCKIWPKLAARLHDANLAHGDLQHGNILLVQEREAKLGVKLVDYDGMCVPSLELLKATEVGHPAYQHPQRLREGTYNLQIDRFSHLVIYTALRSLMVGGRKLWERYDDGDNLLFTRNDFEAPNQSAIFKELLGQHDSEVRNLATALAEAARLPVQQAPRLENVLPSGSRPKTAIPKQAPTPAEPSPFVQPTAPKRSLKKEIRKRVFAAVALGCLVIAGIGVAASALIYNPPPLLTRIDVVAPPTKTTSPQTPIADKGERATIDANPPDNGKLAGIWVIRYGNNTTRSYLIDDTLMVRFPFTGLRTARLTEKDGAYLLDFSDAQLERLRFDSDSVHVEHFNPSSSFPNRPATTGVGQKTAIPLLNVTKGEYAGVAGTWTISYILRPAKTGTIATCSADP